MKVLLCGDMDVAETAQWHDALAAALPEARWLDMAAARARPAEVQAAVVANPPPGSLQGLPHLRLIQSLWAGVDRLLADATLPAGVPIARMVDAATACSNAALRPSLSARLRRSNATAVTSLGMSTGPVPGNTTAVVP